MAFSWLINGGDPNYLLTDPPSEARVCRDLLFFFGGGGKFDEGLFTLGGGCNMMKYIYGCVCLEGKQNPI